MYEPTVNQDIFSNGRWSMTVQASAAVGAMARSAQSDKGNEARFSARVVRHNSQTCFAAIRPFSI